MVRSVQSFLCDEKIVGQARLIPFSTPQGGINSILVKGLSHDFLGTQTIPRQIHEISKRYDKGLSHEPRTSAVSLSETEKSGIKYTQHKEIIFRKRDPVGKGKTDKYYQLGAPKS